MYRKMILFGLYFTKIGHPCVQCTDFHWALLNNITFEKEYQLFY